MKTGLSRIRRRGMTLMEMMVIVTIIGLLIVIAVPEIRKVRIRSQDTSFCRDIALLARQIIPQFALDHGDYPPDAAPGVVPEGIGPYLPSSFGWTRPPRIGGLWDWDLAPSRNSKPAGYYAGVAVQRPSRTSAQMLKIDEVLDDGNLETGVFRARESGYVYVVEW
jgi:prepilin-type N-terminal cleavage/methylation domain-containing protein